MKRSIVSHKSRVRKTHRRVVHILKGEMLTTALYTPIQVEELPKKEKKKKPGTLMGQLFIAPEGPVYELRCGSCGIGFRHADPYTRCLECGSLEHMMVQTVNGRYAPSLYIHRPPPGRLMRCAHCDHTFHTDDQETECPLCNERTGLQIMEGEQWVRLFEPARQQVQLALPRQMYHCRSCRLEFMHQYFPEVDSMPVCIECGDADRVREGSMPIIASIEPLPAFTVTGRMSDETLMNIEAAFEQLGREGERLRGPPEEVPEELRISRHNEETRKRILKIWITVIALLGGVVILATIAEAIH